MNTYRRTPGRRRAAERCFTRRGALRAGAAGLAASALAAAGLRATPAPAQAQAATPAATLAPSPGELVDIGGRKIYLECQGDPERGPVIVLLTGYRTSGRYWTDDLLHPEAPRQMVMPSLAKAARVCTYDRPGTYAFLGEELLPSRSDATEQPRKAADVVEELHALLQAAEIPGPYILGAHSLGGLFARLYAATYPDEVAGMVLVDAYSERLEDVMTPAQYADLKKLNQEGGTDEVLEMPGYGEVEAFPWGGDNDVVRAAVAASPLRPMPLAVLSHGVAFPGTDDVPGFAPGELEELLQAHNRGLVTLVPNGRFWVASESGHDIHQDQPELVTEAIQQVLEGVRSPDTWYSLTACCAE